MKLKFKIYTIPYEQFTRFKPGERNFPYIILDKKYFSIAIHTDIVFIWSVHDFTHTDRNKHRNTYYLYEYKKL